MYSVAFLTKQIPKEVSMPATTLGSPDRLITRPAEEGPGAHFGAEFMVALMNTPDGKRPQLMDLESGTRLPEPSLDEFYNNPRAAVTWLKSNGLDISGSAIPGEIPLCIFYYVALVPVRQEAWEELRAEDVLASRELAELKDPKRRCIDAGEGVQTFLFRTREGACGLLRVEGTRPEDQSVQIRYRLAMPGQLAQATALAVAAQ